MTRPLLPLAALAGMLALLGAVVAPERGGGEVDRREEE